MKRTQGIDKFEFPTTDSFKNWVEECLVCLGLPASAFLNDDRPGSKNATNVLLRRTSSIKLDSARRLHSELQERAQSMDIELPRLELTE